MERLTTRHSGVAVIKDKSRHKEAMEKLARYEETREWIPCSEKLPPEPKENPIFGYRYVELYLVSTRYSDYPFRAFWNGEFFADGFSKVEVNAWMPLPEPYKEG